MKLLGWDKQFRYWIFFDFVNSLLYTNIALYFPQWLTIELGVSDFYYNLLLTVSTLLLIFTAPLLGAYADHKRKKVWFLRITSILMILGTLSIPFVVWSGSSTTLVIIVAMLAFFLVNFSYQLSLLFYDSMLGDIAQKEKYIKASGFGLAFGWIGAILGILAIYPLANGSFEGIPSGRMVALTAASCLFFIFSIIPLWKLKEPYSLEEDLSKKPKPKNIFKSVINDIKSIAGKPVIFAFLIAYWFYIDAILTFEENLTIYLERVFLMPDSAKAIVAIILIIGGVLGAMLTAFFVKDKTSKKYLVGSIILAALSLIVLALSPSQNFFIGVIFVSAIFFGVIFTLSRVFYTNLIPSTQRSEYFGFYSISERSASIIGPLIWGGIVSFIALEGVLEYKVALIVMACLMFLSLIPLRRVKL